MLKFKRIIFYVISAIACIPLIYSLYILLQQGLIAGKGDFFTAFILFVAVSGVFLKVFSYLKSDIQWASLKRLPRVVKEHKIKISNSEKKYYLKTSGGSVRAVRCIFEILESNCCNDRSFKFSSGKIDLTALISVGGRSKKINIKHPAGWWEKAVEVQVVADKPSIASVKVDVMRIEASQALLDMEIEIVYDSGTHFDHSNVWA